MFITDLYSNDNQDTIQTNDAATIKAIIADALTRAKLRKEQLIISRFDNEIFIECSPNFVDLYLLRALSWQTLLRALMCESSVPFIGIIEDVGLIGTVQLFLPLSVEFDNADT